MCSNSLWMDGGWTQIRFPPAAAAKTSHVNFTMQMANYDDDGDQLDPRGETAVTAPLAVVLRFSV